MGARKHARRCPSVVESETTSPNHTTFRRQRVAVEVTGTSSLVCLHSCRHERMCPSVTESETGPSNNKSRRHRTAQQRAFTSTLYIIRHDHQKGYVDARAHTHTAWQSLEKTSLYPPAPYATMRERRLSLRPAIWSSGTVSLQREGGLAQERGLLPHEMCSLHHRQ